MMFDQFGGPEANFDDFYDFCDLVGAAATKTYFLCEVIVYPRFLLLGLCVLICLTLGLGSIGVNPRFMKPCIKLQAPSALGDN